MGKNHWDFNNNINIKPLIVGSELVVFFSMANDITQQTTANEMLGKQCWNETIILHYSNSSLVVETLNVVNAKGRASNETYLVANSFDGSYGERKSC